MPAPAWISGFVRWRWMPLVALVSGSLAFVAIAVLVVPEDFESAAGGSLQSSRSRRAENAGSTKESSLALPSLKARLPRQSDQGSSPPERQATSPLADDDNVVQSIFHSAPTIELPVAPPDPNPPPPPPEAPPPAPTATIFTLENPPATSEQQAAALVAPPGVVAKAPTAIVPEVVAPDPTPPAP